MYRLAFLFVGLLAVAIGNAAAFAPINYNVLSSTNLAVGGYEKVTINTKTRLNAAALIVQNKGGGHGELGTHTVFSLFCGIGIFFQSLLLTLLDFVSIFVVVVVFRCC
jgi:hypothetical protein